MQEHLDEAVEWTKNWGFKISTDKTKYMVFGYKKKVPDKSLMICNHTLERVQSFKFLGMWMDERITWKIHVEKIVVKYERVINVLRC